MHIHSLEWRPLLRMLTWRIMFQVFFACYKCPRQVCTRVHVACPVSYYITLSCWSTQPVQPFTDCLCASHFAMTPAPSTGAKHSIIQRQHMPLIVHIAPTMHHMSLQWAHCKHSHYWATSPLASGTENTPNRGHPVGWASKHTIGYAHAHSLPQQAELFRFTRCSSYIRSITPGGRCHPMHHHCSSGPLNLSALAALACLLR